MSITTLNARRAKSADAVAIAKIHDQTWHNAYSGMVPHNALGKMIARRGAAWWASAIERMTIVLVLEIHGQIVGYATIGRNRVKTLPYDGEVYELYLLPEYQGIGLGTHLFLAARREIAERGLKGTVVWVLKDNIQAIRFYENAGGRQIATGSECFDGKNLAKFAFLFD